MFSERYQSEVRVPSTSKKPTRKTSEFGIGKVDRSRTGQIKKMGVPTLKSIFKSTEFRLLPC